MEYHVFQGFLTLFPITIPVARLSRIDLRGSLRRWTLLFRIVEVKLAPGLLLLLGLHREPVPETSVVFTTALRNAQLVVEEGGLLGESVLFTGDVRQV